MASSYFFVHALALAQPALVQTLFGTAPAVVAMLSRVFVGEMLTVRRVLAVILASVGVATVASRGWALRQIDGDSEFFGALLALAAVLAAAVYKVSVRCLLGDMPAKAVLGFLGRLGAASVFLGLPLSVALSKASIEDRWWGSDVGDINWPLIFGGSAVDVVYSVALAYSLTISSPVFVALGTILGIPANLVADLLLRGAVPSVTALGGACVIIISFVLIIGERIRLKQDQLCEGSSQIADHNLPLIVQRSA